MYESNPNRLTFGLQNKWSFLPIKFPSALSVPVPEWADDYRAHEGLPPVYAMACHGRISNGERRDLSNPQHAQCYRSLDNRGSSNAHPHPWTGLRRSTVRLRRPFQPATGVLLPAKGTVPNGVVRTWPWPGALLNTIAYQWQFSFVAKFWRAKGETF